MAFDPLSLSPFLWLQSDVANLYTDAGTTHVSADGDLVYRWADISGNGRHFNQTTSGNRPKYYSGIINSHPAVRFNGTSSYLQYAPTVSGASTLWVVLKIVNDPSTTGSGGCWSNGSGSNSHYPFTDGTIYDGTWTNSRKTTVNPTPSLSSTFRRYCVVSDAGEWSSYLDATQLYTTGTNTTAYPTTLYLGSSDISNYWLYGDVCEFFWMNAKATSQNLSDMDGYLNTRYFGAAATGGLFLASSLSGLGAGGPFFRNPVG